MCRMYIFGCSLCSLPSRSLIMSAAAAAAGARKSPAPSAEKSSEPLPIYEREAFFAEKYRNYCLFVNGVADYAPEVQPLADALRCLPLLGFKMRARGYLEAAIQAHLLGDSQARDVAASEAVREQAHANGFNLTNIRAPDYCKLLRYTSLFALLLAEEQ